MNEGAKMSATPTQTNQQFRDSLIRDASHSERIAMSFDSHHAMFLETINHILDEDGSGLAQKLKKAKQQDVKLRLLQVNCAEGLYLHELARILEERDLLEGAELYGITEDPTQISTADVYSKVAKTPRPYLNFYQHNLHQPLAECLGLHEDLKVTGSVQFDLIFGVTEALILLKDAQLVLTRLYQDNLKPEGLICFTDSNIVEGADGWIGPHPAIADLHRAGMYILHTYNPGPVASEMAGWLREAGANQIVEIKTRSEWGGQTEAGRLSLRAELLTLRLIGPEFVRAGLVSQAQYDQLMQVIYHELTPQHIGQLTFYTAIAKKS
jgi:hypothetical protein